MFKVLNIIAINEFIMNFHDTFLNKRISEYKCHINFYTFYFIPLFLDDLYRDKI